ncbi:unnamed protein product [Fraxinus pennsylvanica]|uniref:Zeaxanthin epoxidase n=1 Tax=Fraxinus pennsylvanica TaxID=56036 RepID=A0AAD1YWI7_9LAMI|nr:unnamed protein product [Fraxinus pennsylvanica]
MISPVLYNPVNISTAVFSRTHLGISKDFPAQLYDSLHNKFYSRSRENGQIKKLTKVMATLDQVPKVEPAETDTISRSPERKLRILVAGGGIGGLVFALAAKKKGFDVVVFEKDLSAIRGEGQYRGPIQIQSNALATLEAIDVDVAEEVMSARTV